MGGLVGKGNLNVDSFAFRFNKPWSQEEENLMKVPLSITLPREHVAALKKLAEFRQTPVASLMRAATRRWLQRRRFNKPYGKKFTNLTRT